jgi:hypothetical protein
MYDTSLNFVAVSQECFEIVEIGLSSQPQTGLTRP